MPPAKLNSPDRATKVLDDFWFVAAHVHVGDVIGAMSERLGIPAAMQHHNKTDYLFRTRETLPSDFVERVYRENAVDRYLFERYAERRFDSTAVRSAERPTAGNGLIGAEVRRALFYVREIFFPACARLGSPDIDSGASRPIFPTGCSPQAVKCREVGMLRPSIVALIVVAVLGGCAGHDNGQYWFYANPDFRTPTPGPHGKFPRDRGDYERTEPREPF